MLTGSMALGNACGRSWSGPHGATALRDHRKCLPRIFTGFDLGRTGSHHYGRVRRIENDLFREVSRRANSDDASVHVNCGRALGGRRQISIGCQEQAEKHAADVNEIFDDRHEPPLIEPGGRARVTTGYSAIVPLAVPLLAVIAILMLGGRYPLFGVGKDALL